METPNTSASVTKPRHLSNRSERSFGSKLSHKQLVKLIRDDLEETVNAGKPYEFVILEWHGQNQGKPYGFFDDLDRLAELAANFDANAMPVAIYRSLNPVSGELFATSPNAIRQFTKSVEKGGQDRMASASPADIPELTRLMIDYDVSRAKGAPKVSSTDEEKALCESIRDECLRWLAEEFAFPQGLAADSGNGAHAYFDIALPNTAENVRLLERCLEAVALRYAYEPRVTIDPSVADPGQLTKVFGTMARKGPNDTSRPHRGSHVTSAPTKRETVTRERLVRLAALAPEPPKASKSKSSRFDIDRWLKDYRVPVGEPQPWRSRGGGEGRVWVFRDCPFEDHNGRDKASIQQFSDGGISAGCMKANCQHNGEKWGWEELREKFEPGFRDKLTDEYTQNSKPTKVDQLARVVEESGASLFHSANRRAFIDIQRDGGIFTLELESELFIDWLLRLARKKLKFLPSDSDIKRIVRQLMAEARDRECREVALRIAKVNGTVYYDLGRDDWKLVEVTSSGWSVIDYTAALPIRFRRSQGMQAQQLPERGGRIDELWSVVNVNEEDRVRLLIWLVSALYPGGPQPWLGIDGHGGSGKSTLTSIALKLVDPNDAELRKPPKSEKDLRVFMNSAWVLAFDNVSNITQDQSDLLCGLATGLTLSDRKLYSDYEQASISGKRPLIMNGIGAVGWAEDFMQRGIRVNMRSIDRRIGEEELWPMFEAMRARVLGCLFDAVAQGLRDKAKVGDIENPVRLIDLQRFSYAALPALGVSREHCEEAFESNRKAGAETVIDSSPLAQRIIEFSKRGPWAGTASQLLQNLSQAFHGIEKERWFPRSPGKLAKGLKRLAGALSESGVLLTEPEKSGNRGDRVRTLTRRDGDYEQPAIPEQPELERWTETAVEKCHMRPK
jgi:hypothetical protein